MSSNEMDRMRLFVAAETESPELYEDLPPDPVSESQARSSLYGREFDLDAIEFLEQLGAEIADRDLTVEGYHLDAEIVGENGARFYVDAHGTPDRTRDDAQAGMRRTDTMLKFGFKALRLRDRGCTIPVLLITSHLPRPNSQSAYLLTELSDALFDAVATVGDLPGQQRLRKYFTDEAPHAAPLPAPWRAVQLPLAFDPFGDDGEQD